MGMLPSALLIYAAIFWNLTLFDPACMRPELVCAECCDIHAVFVPLSASLVACRLLHLSSSVNSLTHAHRGSVAFADV